MRIGDRHTRVRVSDKHKVLDTQAGVPDTFTCVSKTVAATLVRVKPNGNFSSIVGIVYLDGARLCWTH